MERNTHATHNAFPVQEMSTKEALCSSSCLSVEDAPYNEVSYPLDDRKIDRYLSNLFLQIGIPANKLGFRFLREAVRLVLEDPSLQNRLMRGLYPLVAERFGTSVYCVEHSIRCAITAAWNRGRPELVEKLLGRGVITPYDKPTNGELIALVAENARLLIADDKLE